MSGETEENISGWTTDTLHAHLISMIVALDRRTDDRFIANEKALKTAFDSSEKANKAALDAQDRAIVKAENATEKRFESVNEFRAQLSDQAGRFIARVEFDASIDALRAEQVSAAARNAERIQALADRMNRSEGKGLGLNAGWVYILGALAALGTLFTFYVALRQGG